MTVTRASLTRRGTLQFQERDAGAERWRVVGVFESTHRVPLATLARACKLTPEAFRRRAAKLGATRENVFNRQFWTFAQSRAVEILREYRAIR